MTRIRKPLILLLTIVAMPVMSSDTAAADPLTVVTINLRSHYDNAAERLPAIRSFLETHDPDIVFLQEVAARGEDSDAHRLGEGLGYHVAHEHNNRTRRGLAVLSRHPIRDTAVIRLPKNRRPVLGVVVDVDGALLSAVNLHLTPQLGAGRTRELELRSVLRLARTLPGPTLVAGDFNFGDAAPENRVLRGLVDLYREFRPDADGYTWDLRNPLARKNGYPTEPSRRLDRILVTDSDADVILAEVVLDEPTEAGVYPSDHFGLLATVSLFPPPAARVAAPDPGPQRPTVHQPRPGP